MSVRFRLTTLGSLGLYRDADGEPGPPVLGAGKPLALITYLALSPDRSSTRCSRCSPRAVPCGAA